MRGFHCSTDIRTLHKTFGKRFRRTPPRLSAITSNSVCSFGSSTALSSGRVTVLNLSSNSAIPASLFGLTDSPDCVLVPLGMLIMALYHLWYLHRIYHHPLTTSIGVNHASRRAWVEFIMQDHDKRAILAVQTLRNWITAALQLASTAIVISSGIAGYVSSSTPDPVHMASLHWCHTGAKLVAVLTCFLIAFFSLVLSIRSLNHVGFLVAVPPQCDLGNPTSGKTITPSYVSGVLALGSDFYSFGIRCYYFAFPLLMWFFGALPMFLCSLATVLVLCHVDRARGHQLQRNDPCSQVVV